MPLEAAEIKEITARIFEQDFLDYVFGSTLTPFQLVEDYFFSLVDNSWPPKSLIFKIGPNFSPSAGVVWFENINWLNRNLIFTIYVFPEFRTKGIGPKTLYHAGYIAFNILNMKKIKSFVYENNRKMKKILRHIGASYEGLVKDFRLTPGGFQNAELFSFTAEAFHSLGVVEKGRKRWSG